MRPELTLVIAVRNEAKHLDRLLGSINNQTYDKRKLEIIVYDGESSDNTLKILRRHQKKLKLRILNNPMKWHVYAYNMGLQAAKGKYISFPVGHSYYDKDYFERATSVLTKKLSDDGSIAAVGGRLIFKQSGRENDTVTDMMQSRLTTRTKYKHSQKAGFQDTVPIAVYVKSEINNAGGFDEKLTTGQDLELNLRLVKSERKLYFDPRLVSHYYARPNICRFLTQRYYYARARGVVIRKGHFRLSWTAPLLYALAQLAGLALIIAGQIIGGYLLVLTVMLLYTAVVVETKTIFKALAMTFNMIALYYTLAMGLMAGLITNKVRRIKPDRVYDRVEGKSNAFDPRRLPKTSPIGWLVRLPLAAIPKKTVLPILSGRFKGMKWVVGTGLHSTWIGIFELTKRRTIERIVKNGAVFYDVGAHAGYFTLLSSVLVGTGGEVHAFEPLPQNLKALRKHVQLNRLQNVVVCEKALADKKKQQMFEIGESSSTGRLSNKGSIPVVTTTLDSYVYDEGKRPPNYIKIDVEGAELKVLKGAKRILREVKPTLLIDTHSEELRDSCIELLKGYGYKVSSMGDGFELLAIKG